MKTSRNYWPLGIVLVFVLFFSGMATFVVIACQHRDCLVSENYYEQELLFQNQIDGAARAAKAGATVRFDAAKSLVTIAVPAAQLAQKLTGTVELYRPAEPKDDRHLALAPRADGTQTLDVSKLAPGSWSVRAKWDAGGEHYYLEQKISL